MGDLVFGAEGGRLSAGIVPLLYMMACERLKQRTRFCHMNLTTCCPVTSKRHKFDLLGEIIDFN